MATRRRNVEGLGTRAPLFELKGKWARIELSAYVAGLSLCVGILLVGSQNLQAASVLNLILVIASFLTFLFLVMFIQGRMGFAPTAKSFGKPQHLVTQGLFQYTRNPIYATFLLPLASLSLLSVFASATAIGTYIGLMNLTVLRTEERDLLTLFGQTYVDYAAQVPRWLL